VTFALPVGDLHLAIERHVIDNAIIAWQTMPVDQHKKALWSIKKTLNRIIERVQKRTATQQESDNLAADAALWLAHELLYADGERHLRKNPSTATLVS
jgi:hypothetical protein